MTYSVAAPAHSELVVRKSRFLGCVQSVTDRAEAQAVVAALKTSHPDAVHVCWALMAGGQSAAVDDGEPSGTAGRPMLEVLRHHDLDGVLATVVRYFGGIKLGAGGLVRAYTDCVAQALAVAEKVERIHLQSLVFGVPYAQEGLVRRILEMAGALIQDIRHDDAVRFHVQIAQAHALSLVRQLNESTHGRLVWDETGNGVNV